VCVTCTPSRRAFVFRDDVPPGTFVAAVGADNRGKQEREPALVASSALVVDVLEQCAEIGELQHALAARLMTREDVHAELADVVTGRRPGRTRDDEITVFDSTGTALQDVAAAVTVYGKAFVSGHGTEVTLDD
jgi:alanine dehydrogenase